MNPWAVRVTSVVALGGDEELGDSPRGLPEAPPGPDPLQPWPPAARKTATIAIAPLRDVRSCTVCSRPLGVRRLQAALGRDLGLRPPVWVDAVAVRSAPVDREVRGDLTHARPVRVHL